MASTHLERARALEEDLDQYEDACAELLTIEVKRYREQVLQDWRVKQFVDKIREKHERLREIYADEERSLKDEILDLDGDPTSVETFAKFYEKARERKEKYDRADRARTEEQEHEARWLLSDEGKNAILQQCLAAFSPVESLGRYVDLTDVHRTFCELPGLATSDATLVLDYASFLDELLAHRLPTAPSHPTKTHAAYLQYLVEFSKYLYDFTQRSKPLTDLQALQNSALHDFSTQWLQHTWTSDQERDDEAPNQPNGMDLDANNNDAATSRDLDWLLPWQLDHLTPKSTSIPSTLYCTCCHMSLAKDTVWKSHIASKKHTKALEKYMQHVKEVSWQETWILKLLNVLQEVLEATKEHIEKKLARLPGEAAYMGAAEDENGLSDGDDDNSSDDEPDGKIRRRMMKKNYPIGPDGNPLPYWLYRLQGLSHEFKCQICGNATYRGRRAFERHFADAKHSYGLKCLGIDNSKEYFEITSIEKALELHKHLTAVKAEGKWDPNTMEEFEDEDGAILDKATHDLLAKQLGM